MTLPIERARTRRPITWLTLVGVILLPVLIGGILVAALSNPTERLENISAAIVNNDKPVTIDGQLVPLGRQLTAGLIDGAGESADGEGADGCRGDDSGELLCGGDLNCRRRHRHPGRDRCADAKEQPPG